MSIKTAAFRSVDELDDRSKYYIDFTRLNQMMGSGHLDRKNYAINSERGQFVGLGSEFKKIYNDLNKNNPRDAADFLRYSSEGKPSNSPSQSDKPEYDSGGGGGSLPPPPSLNADGIDNPKRLSAALVTFVSKFSGLAEEISEQLDHEGLMGKGSTFGGGSAYGAKFLAQAEKIGALAIKLPNSQIVFGGVNTQKTDKGSSPQFDFVKKLLGALGIVVGDWFAGFMASQEGADVIEALQNRGADLKTLVSSSQEGSIYVNKIGLLLANAGGKLYYIGPMSASNIQNNLPAALGILQQMAQQNPRIQIASQNPIVWRLVEPATQTAPAPTQDPQQTNTAPPQVQPQTPPPPAGAAHGSVMLDKLIKVANILEDNEMYEDADTIDGIIREAGLMQTVREQLFAPGDAIKKFTPEDTKTWGVALPKWRDYFTELKGFVISLQQDPENQKNPLVNQLVTLVSSLADNFNGYAEKQIGVLQQLRRRKMKPTMVDRLTGQPQRARVAT